MSIFHGNWNCTTPGKYLTVTSDFFANRNIERWIRT